MSRVIINPAQMTELLRGPNGLVYKDMARRCVRVTTLAKQQCPVKTGRLRSSIRWYISPGPVGHVGTDIEYAKIVHNGSQPHEIRPKQAKVLAFKIGNTTVFAAVVNHPGTKGNPFLINALTATMKE